MSVNSPARPAAAKDVETMLSGRLTLLGELVSTGAAVDNSSATSLNAQGAAGGFFSVIPTPGPTFNNGVPYNWGLTLAGRVLVVQATAAGSILIAGLPIGTPNQPTVTGLVAATNVTQPGIKIQAEERVPFIMNAQDGWLQFIPTSGSANLFIWEAT